MKPFDQKSTAGMMGCTAGVCVGKVTFQATVGRWESTFLAWQLPTLQQALTKAWTLTTIVIHRPSSIVHGPSSIVHHPSSSTIHHPPPSLSSWFGKQNFFKFAAWHVLTHTSYHLPSHIQNLLPFRKLWPLSSRDATSMEQVHKTARVRPPNCEKSPRLVAQQMGVSKKKGTPKWMVYNGKPY